MIKKIGSSASNNDPALIVTPQNLVLLQFTTIHNKSKSLSEYQDSLWNRINNAQNSSKSK